MNANRPKPRILLLIDRLGWAFHTIAEAIAFHLSDKYDFTILAVSDAPEIDANRYDILHIFGGDQTYHHLYPKGSAKVLKGIYAHLWLKHGFAIEDFYRLHLRDADAITVPSLRLFSELQHMPIPVHLFPEGVDTGTFTPQATLKGPLIAGWAGSVKDPIKRVHLAKQACDGICELRIADGTLSLREMVDFYNQIDVILCTSEAEGCPRPVLEAMACGRYPVSFPVGILPEVVAEPMNGTIVHDASVAGMRAALHTYAKNPHLVRNTTLNAQYIRAHRQWQSTVWHLTDIYDNLLR